MAVGAEGADVLRYLRQEGGRMSDVRVGRTEQTQLTLFNAIASSNPFAHSGFKSFAHTKTPFFPAGTANGPTPAITSHTISPGLNLSTNLACSVLSRLFQNTLL